MTTAPPGGATDQPDAAAGVSTESPDDAAGVSTESPDDAAGESTESPDAAGSETEKVSRARAGWRAVTMRGRVTAVVAVAALLLGLATGWREWIGVSAGLAMVLVAAAAMSIGRSPVAAELAVPRRRFVVGEPGAASVSLRNTSGRRMLPLRMELDVARVAVSVPVPSLHGGQSHLVGIPLPTGHRAVLELGPLRAVRGDVFGLIRRVVQWPLQQDVYVHPRTVRPQGSLPGWVHDLDGEESTQRTASDLSFHTLREYVPGDDRRFIHWKSTARSGTLQVREFLQTHRSQVVVVLSGRRGDYHWAGDATARPAESLDEGTASDGGAAESGPPLPRRGAPIGADDEFEIAVGVAASMVAELVRQQRDVVTDAAGTDVRGATADGVLDQFCAVEAAAESPDLIFETRRMIRRNPRASLVVLVFGSAVGAAQVRAAVRACPAAARVVALRARSGASPHPQRLTGSEGYSVVTLGDVEELPAALRAIGARVPGAVGHRTRLTVDGGAPRGAGGGPGRPGGVKR